MKACEQAPGWSIFHHGMDVAARYKDLHEHVLQGERSAYAWGIPSETLTQLEQLRCEARGPAEARAYHVYHDCGKPYTLEIDAEGRRHFPNHAQVSAEIFRRLFPGDEISARLIEKDMLCHTLKGEEAEKFASDPDAPTLIITAWAELHSNAEKIFGGLDSTSFKIKRKKLIKMVNIIHRELLRVQNHQFGERENLHRVSKNS